MIEKIAQPEKRRFFLVWKCLKKRDCMPVGKPRSSGCGRWNLKSSKHPLGGHPHLKGNCPACGNAPRLNLHPHVESFDTKEAALRAADMLNAQMLTMRGEEE